MSGDQKSRLSICIEALTEVFIVSYAELPPSRRSNGMLPSCQGVRNQTTRYSSTPMNGNKNEISTSSRTSHTFMPNLDAIPPAMPPSIRLGPRRKPPRRMASNSALIPLRLRQSHRGDKRHIEGVESRCGVHDHADLVFGDDWHKRCQKFVEQLCCWLQIRVKLLGLGCILRPREHKLNP